MSDPKDKISRRELLKLALPFGKLYLDSAQCTGCGLCALDCPTQALTAASGEDTYQLLFHHERCTVCERCVKVCPGQCLHLERTLELDRLNAPPAVLFEDSLARCRQCDRVIGPRALISSLQAKLEAMGNSLASQLELCPECKVKQFSLGRAVPKPIEDKDNGNIA